MFPWLDQQPNRAKANFLIKGFTFGFPLPEFLGIGCEVVLNLKSVLSFSEVVEEKISKEIAEDRIAGPFKYPHLGISAYRNSEWFPPQKKQLNCKDTAPFVSKREFIE